jgi:hypothetical protein
MGFSTIIDIIGASVIGGILLLVLLQLNDKSTENTYTFGSELTVQQNLVQLLKFWNMISEKSGIVLILKKYPNPKKQLLLPTQTILNSLRI